MKKIKIYATYKPVDKPWGGANNFIRALYRHVGNDNRFEFVDSVNDECDILFMNQTSLGPVNNSRLLQFSEIKKIVESKSRRTRLVVRAINLRMHAYPPGIRGLLPALRHDREIIKLLNFADYVIFQSNYQYSFFKKGGFRGKSYSIVHNGGDDYYIDDSPRPFLEDGPLKVVSTIATGRKTKRHDILSRLSRIPDVSVVHAGRWPDDTPKEKVELKGVLDQAAISELYRTAHYFVHPAIKDPCPNAIFEAVLSGLPVLYNPDVGSSREIVGMCGLPIEIEALDKVVEMARRQYSVLIAAVRENKPYYSIKRAAGEYMEIFGSVVR